MRSSVLLLSLFVVSSFACSKSDSSQDGGGPDFGSVGIPSEPDLPDETPDANAVASSPDTALGSDVGTPAETPHDDSAASSLDTPLGPVGTTDAPPMTVPEVQSDLSRDLARDLASDLAPDLAPDLPPKTCQGVAGSCSAQTYSSGCVAAGCSWRAADCLGTATTCSQISSETTCRYQPGCSWVSTSSSSTTYYCSGYANACSLQNLSSTCTQIKGCTWQSDACTGTPKACSSLLTQSACTGQVGCSWK